MAKELPELETAGRPPLPYKARMILFIAPILISLVLAVIFVSQHRAVSPVERVLRSQDAGGGISIRQKSSSRSPGIVEEKQTIQVETIEDGLREMGFLVTEEYYFTEMLTNRKAQSILNVELGFTEESYTVSYEGYITAGIDFGAIDVSVDEEAKTVTVALPPARLKDTVIEPESLKVYSEKSSIFTTITEEERGKAMAQFSEDVRKKAEQKGVLKKADDNAKLMIRNFVRSLVPSDYRIQFTEKVEGRS